MGTTETKGRAGSEAESVGGGSSESFANSSLGGSTFEKSGEVSGSVAEPVSSKMGSDIRSKYLHRLGMQGLSSSKILSGGESIRPSKLEKGSVDIVARSPLDITEERLGSKELGGGGDEEKPLPPPPESLLPSQETIEQEKDTQIAVEQSFSDELSEGISLNFIQKKDANQIRQSYLKKLVYSKVWLLPEQKPKSHQTVIIFDWDDTLLCTSHLNPTGYLQDLMLPRPLTTQLRNLDKASAQILNLALDNGKLFIITNAAPGWVEFSARKYLPEVFELLSKITIISARGAFEAKYPGNCHQWKMLAFMETQKDLDDSAITNLLALGDSNIEIDAAHHLATKFQKALIKTVKFRQSPSPEELVKQLHLVHQKFNQICHSVRNLTIRLERKSSRAGAGEPRGPSIDGPAPPPGA